MTTIPESTWEEARAIFRSLPKEADAITAIAHALHRARQEATEKAADIVESFAPGGDRYEYGHSDAWLRVAIRSAILGLASHE